MGSGEYLGLRNAVKPLGHHVAQGSDVATIAAGNGATSPREQAEPFSAPDPVAAEAELRAAALPDGAVVILARLEALACKDPPAA